MGPIYFESFYWNNFDFFYALGMECSLRYDNSQILYNNIGILAKDSEFFKAHILIDQAKDLFVTICQQTLEWYFNGPFS